MKPVIRSRWNVFSGVSGAQRSKCSKLNKAVISSEPYCQEAVINTHDICFMPTVNTGADELCSDGGWHPAPYFVLALPRALLIQSIPISELSEFKIRLWISNTHNCKCLALWNSESGIQFRLLAIIRVGRYKYPELAIEDGRHFDFSSQYLLSPCVWGKDLSHPHCTVVENSQKHSKRRQKIVEVRFH